MKAFVASLSQDLEEVLTVNILLAWKSVENNIR